MSRLEVCHAAGGDAQTSQHWREADRDRVGMNPQPGFIKDACVMTSEGSAKMELARSVERLKKAAHVALVAKGWRHFSNDNARDLG